MNRRRVLRGLLHGGAISVALPFLNCFLNDNGTALASGAPMPLRFGTWFWALGMNRQLFIPKKIGANYDLPEELASLRPVREYVNVFTNFNVFKDSNPNQCHHTGWITLRTGISPTSSTDFPGETIDVTVANKVGGATPFRLLNATATGDRRDTVSYQGQTAQNAAEHSVVGFYQRLFGPDYRDPNAATFTPSPQVMAKRSVLSAVLEDSKDLNKRLGAEDRARVDQYFTGIRELERQLDQQLSKPQPIASCRRPAPPASDGEVGMTADLVAARHDQMAALMAMAVACDQSRVFNMSYANPFAATTRAGADPNLSQHHGATHVEAIDPHLGYQPQVSWFTRRAIESWSSFVTAFANIKEGDGTLLDNTLIFAHSDQELAKIHSIEGIPMFTAGRAGGRVKTGLHVTGNGDPGCRLGYTCLKIMGVDVESWGTQSNRTSNAISEIVV